MESRSSPISYLPCRRPFFDPSALLFVSGVLLVALVAFALVSIALVGVVIVLLVIFNLLVVVVVLVVVGLFVGGFPCAASTFYRLLVSVRPLTLAGEGPCIPRTWGLFRFGGHGTSVGWVVGGKEE
jgi:hypothetical protein